MSLNQVTARTPACIPGRIPARSRAVTAARWVGPLLTATGAAGAGYTLTWIAGLSVPAPSPALDASGAAVVAGYAGHWAAAAVNFTLTEGLPAVGLTVITVALARAVGGTRGRVLRAAGLAAAVFSCAEFVLGLVLARTSDPGPAHLLWAAVGRLDGLKMIALAVLGAAAAGAGPGGRAVLGAALPRWLRCTAAALAVSMTLCGVIYLLLMQSLAVAAGPALLFLLLFMTGAGMTLGAKAR